MPGLTCIVPTLNEAANIEACLATLRFADELLVVDSFSTDDTPRLAARFGARVLQHEHRSPGEQRQWAMEQAAHEWVAMIDADERVGSDLAQEIREAIATGTHRGYEIKRENYFLGHRIRRCGWQHDWVLRVFRRASAHYSSLHIHERPTINGTVGRLKSRLVHHPYRTLDDYWRKLHRYAEWNAQEARAEGRRMSPVYMAMHPPLRFLRSYLLQGGFLDGRAGLILSLLNAVYVTVKDVTIWQTQEPLPEEHREVRP